MNRFRRTFLVAGLLLLAAAIAGVAQPRFARSADTTPSRTITVTGSGSVIAVPDRASFQFTVDTRGSTATAALSTNADAEQAVVAALKSAGVASADLQTTEVSLSPQTTQDGTRIVGYAASSSVSVTIPIDRAGAVVDAAVKAGADGVSGPSLSLSDQGALYNAALKKAVANAQTKASAIADAAGLHVGSVQTVVEGSAPQPVLYQHSAAPAASGSITVEPGTQETDATVTVTYSAS